MIKILHLAHAFFPERSGTAERIFYSQPRDGFKHFIIKPGNEDSTYEYEGFVIHTVKLNLKKKSILRTYNNARLPKYAKKLINKHDIKLLYGHNPVLLSMATLITLNYCNNIKLIYEPHNLLYSQYLNQVDKNLRFFYPKILLKLYYSYLIEIEKRLFKKSEFIISQTMALKNQILKIYYLNPEKIIVGYNGLPEHKISLLRDQILENLN